MHNINIESKHFLIARKLPDCLHTSVVKRGVTGKLREALDAVLEAVQDVRKVKLKVLSHDLPRGLEGELHDVLVVVGGGEVEDGEDVGPAGLDVVALHVDHVGHTPHHHVPHRPALVVLHDVLERSQKILLEMKVWKFSLLYELLGQLSERVDSKEGDVLGLAAAHQVEMVAQHLPDPAPLQSDPPHVVVGDLHQLGQAEHPGLRTGCQLVYGDLAQSPHKVNDCIAVQLGGTCRGETINN